MNWLRRIEKVSVRFIQIGCFVILTDKYVGSFVRCAGSSMEPTLFNQDVVLAENITVHRNTLQKGDIVIAKSPTDPTEFICKRLVAMEGDRVWVTVDEGNDTSDDNCEIQQKIPKGYVWLEGDNRSNSYDCKHYGPIPAGLLTRRVFFRIWPVSNMGFVKHPDELKKW